MRSICIAIMLLAAHSGFCQDSKQEINQQVWRTFIEGYNEYDVEKFMSVYSKDVVRVPIDEKRIFNYLEYRKAVSREYQFNKNYNVKSSIEIRFNERIQSADKAYERGVIKIKLIDNNGKPETLYSRFQVVLQKEKGIWRITFDSDSTEGLKLTEKDFAAATPL